MFDKVFVINGVKIQHTKMKGHIGFLVEDVANFPDGIKSNAIAFNAI
jgi:hypothetical protein